GVGPDLTCLGIVIGGALPVGAYGGKREIMENVAPAGEIYQAGTLSVNPLAMTAGYETLRALDEEAYSDLNKKADRLVDGYTKASETYGITLQINRAGYMLGFFFTDQPVVNFATAQTSNLSIFTHYYKAMINY